MYKNVPLAGVQPQKVVLDVSLLNTQHYNVQIKDKGSNLNKRIAPSPTPRCSSY